MTLISMAPSFASCAGRYAADAGYPCVRQYDVTCAMAALSFESVTPSPMQSFMRSVSAALSTFSSDASMAMLFTVNVASGAVRPPCCVSSFSSSASGAGAELVSGSCAVT